MATLADGGRISTALVDAEIQRLRWLWQPAGELRHAQTGDSARSIWGDGAGPYASLDQDLDRLLPAGMARTLDLFDRLQLEAVVRVCRECTTLSEAGRRLFDQSRTQRSVVNDADRLRKYLLKFGLGWEAVRG